jgi:hypothetical protein
VNSEEDGIGSIFGGNLNPGISGRNQISKIMIKMSERSDSASPPSKEKEEPNVEIATIQTVTSVSVTSFSVTSFSSPPSEPESKRPRIGTPIVSSNKPVLLKV